MICPVGVTRVGTATHETAILKRGLSKCSVQIEDPKFSDETGRRSQRSGDI